MVMQASLCLPVTSMAIIAWFVPVVKNPMDRLWKGLEKIKYSFIEKPSHIMYNGEKKIPMRSVRYKCEAMSRK